MSYVFQAKAGLKSDSSPSSQARTPTDNRVLTDSINENLPRSIDPQFEVLIITIQVYIVNLYIRACLLHIREDSERALAATFSVIARTNGVVRLDS